MRASLPLDRWPVIEERYEFSPERKVFLVLRDGTEIDSGGTSEGWQPERTKTANEYDSQAPEVVEATKAFRDFVEARRNFERTRRSRLL